MGKFPEPLSLVDGYLINQLPTEVYMEKKQLNHRINMLYRQLGKSVYSNNKLASFLSKDEKKICTTLEKLIVELQTLETTLEKLPQDAVIIAPTTNEEGMYIYKFCKKCRVGNNPQSTHCSNCYEPI